jgi:alpha-1,2-mannosyltransferase
VNQLGRTIGCAAGRIDPRLAGLLFFVVLLIVYLATGSVDVDAQSPDPVAAALPAWTWALHHTLYLDHVNTPNVWVYAPKNHLVSNRTPGIVFFSIPFYVLFGRAPVFSMFPATLAAAVAAAGGVTFMLAALRRLVSPRLAIGAALVLAFGTSTWSVSADALWPHGPDELFLAAAVYFLARDKYLFAALAIALCVPVRPQVAVVALIAGVWLAIRRRSGWPLLTFGVPTAVSIGMLSFYNHWMFGRWALQGGYQHVDRSLKDVTALGGRVSLPLNILGALFSTDRGLLIWCPILILLLFSLRPAWRAAPEWVRISALGGLAYLLIQLKLNYFSGGDRFWSYRLMIEPLLLAVPLLTLAARETVHRPRVVQALACAAVVYGFGTQAIGAIFFVADDLRMHSPWTYSHLWTEVSQAGVGPRAVMAATLVTMVAAFVLSMRRTRPVRAEQPDGLTDSKQIDIVASDCLP